MSSRPPVVRRLGSVVALLVLCGLPLGGTALPGDRFGTPAPPAVASPPQGGPTWWVAGGQAGAHLGTSLASAGDVNGDGIDDLIVGAPDFDSPSTTNPHEGRAFVYLGTPLGPSTTPIWTADGTDRSFGKAVASAGDVNGDGFDDILVGEPDATRIIPFPEVHGGVSLYLGSSSGPQATPAWKKDLASDHYGSTVASAGDVNGDGYDDVLVSSVSSFSGARVFLYLGSAAGLAATSAWVAQGGSNSTEPFGMTLAAGDVNGDGYGDVLVGEPGYRAACNLGRVYLYYGSSSGLSQAPALTITGGANCDFQSARAGCTLSSGNLNGDAYADFLVGCTGTALAEYFGSPSGPTGTTWPSGGWLVGDVNGDGFDDAAAGSSLLSLYQGGPAGLSPTPVWSINLGGLGAVMVAGAGDTDGDHRANLLLGAPSFELGPADEGVAYLFFGPAVVPCASDADGDGYCASGAGADCNDADPAIHPNAAERCNGADDDCDGQKDEGFGIGTACTAGLGFCSSPGHVACADEQTTFCSAPASGQSSPEKCDGVDNDCDGLIDDGQPDACRIASTPVPGARLGETLVRVGDVNGDGFDDVLAGAPAWGAGSPQSDQGHVHLYYGSASGTFRTPDWTYAGTQTSPTLSERASFGWAMAGIGDLDGDGYADFIVGAPGYNYFQVQTDFGSAGAAYVFHGSPGGPQLSSVISGGKRDRFGSAIAGGGDIDGDGVGDFIIGAGPAFNAQPYVVIYRQGGASRTTIFGVTGCAIASDVNGDGFDDVLLPSPAGSPSAGLDVYYGGAGGIATSPALTLHSGGLSPIAFAGVGDVDHDGYGDVLVGWDGISEKASLYLGSAAGLSPVAAWSSDGGQGQSAFGSSLAPAGDVNHDGFADVIIGAPLYVTGGQTRGAAFLYLGGSTGLEAAPVWTGTVTTQTSTAYGAAVAGVGDYDQDGLDDLVVGAPRFDSGGATESGRVDLMLSRVVCGGTDLDQDGIPQCVDICGFLPDNCDNCPATSNGDQADADGDGLGDVCDNCPAAANPAQEDGNHDGSGDACQPSVDIGEIASAGPDVLEAHVSLHDPQSENLSGKVAVVAPAALLEAFETFDCSRATLPDGRPGQSGRGIAYIFYSFDEPILIDIDWLFTCDDGVADYEIAKGHCTAAPEGFSPYMPLSELSPPAALCVRSVGSTQGVDWTLVSVDPGAARFLIEGHGAVVEVPFASALPPSIDISGIAPSTPYALSITATDGNTFPITASEFFQRTTERTLRLVTPGSAPVAAIAPVAPVECDRPAGGPVLLDGSGSTDADSSPGTNDDIASFDWYEGSPGESLLGSGKTLSLVLPLGAHAITLKATDRAGRTGTAAATVTVADTLPPTLALATDPGTLWPPNHGLVPVQVGWQVGDACDPAGVGVRLLSVSSSEPDDATGGFDGETPADVQEADLGTADEALLLRAERDGRGSGRIYTLTYRATDASGNSATALATVTVPHDLGHGPEPLLLQLEAAAGKEGGARIFWPAVSGATGYDVITGDLAGWNADPARGVLDVGSVRALARGTTATSLTESAGTMNPPVGHVFFYLVQQHTAAQGIGFGTESAPLPRVAVNCEGGCPDGPENPGGGREVTPRK